MTNVDNSLLKQMQKLASSITAMQGTASKDKNNQAAVSFQDMMQQSGGKISSKKSKFESKDPVKGALKDKAEEGLEEGKLPVQNGEKEELKPEDLTANPNAVNLISVIRPEIIETKKELIDFDLSGFRRAIIDDPVPVMYVQNQTPEMETDVGTGMGPEVAMEQQPESFGQSMEEAFAQETPVEQQPVQAQQADTAPVEQAVQQEDKPEIVEKIEVRTENRDDSEETHGEAMVQETPVFHDTKAVPVKVGERYETVDTQKPEMEKQIAGTISDAAQNGAERVEIHLTPQNLGSLVIEMTKDTTGVLQVVLHAATPKAEGLLNQHLSGLHNALLGYGHEEVHLEVQRGQESQEQHFKQADPDGRGQHQGHQQQQRQEETSENTQEFLQKLRLGLFGMDE